MWNRIFHWLELHILYRVSPDPNDKRYPRQLWFRVLRGIMRPWWLIFVLYLTGVIFNLITLAAQYGLTALLNFSKVAQALLLPRLVQLLEQQLWMAVLWVVMVVIVILLGYWAHKDREFEHTVLTLREDQKRQSKTHDELEKQVRKIAHPITASGIGNIASSGPVINSPISNTFITNNFNIEDKRSPYMLIFFQTLSTEGLQGEALQKKICQGKTRFSTRLDR
jgi:hypothetical protein